MEQNTNYFLQEAIHENTDPERLKQLFALPNPKIKLLLAKNPNTPPELLNQLAQNPNITIRKYTAMNPSTPKEILLCLAYEFPKTVLNNPVFPLLLLEDPNLVAKIPFNSLLSLLKCREVPLHFIDWAINRYTNNMNYVTGFSDASTVFLSLALNPQTSRNVLELIERISDSNIQESAQLHVNNAGELQDLGGEEIAQAILNTSTISSEFKQQLLEFSEIQLTLPFIPKQYSPISLSLEEIASHRFTPQHLLKELADHTNWEIRYGVASNSNTSAKTLTDLANDSHWWIRQEVARNYNTPPQILAQLVQRENQPELLKTLALNPHTPLTVLQDLNHSTTDPEIAEITTLLLSGKAPLQPVHKVQPVSESISWEQRYQWANDSQTAPRILEQLARDPDLGVRVAVAKNPNTPTRILVEFARETEQTFEQKCRDYPLNPQSLLGHILSDHPSYWLKEEALKNPRTPARVISQLLRNYLNDDKMCRSIAKSHHLSWKTLQALIHLNDSSLYLDLATNPSIPTYLLEKVIQTQLNYSLSKPWLFPLARYFALKPTGVLDISPHIKALSSSEILFFISLMPQTPAKFLFKFIYSSDWLQRYIIAIHPNTPNKIIKFLFNDVNRIVRAAARTKL